MNHTTHDRILWVTRTAVLVALLVVLQYVTAGTSAFAGQYITGSCVNAVLAIAVLAAGLWSGVTVAIISPFCAKLFGIGPALVQIIPAISVGNLVFVLILYLLVSRKEASPLWQRFLGLVVAAALKFATLYVLVNKVIVPMLASGLKPKQIAMFGVMFSYPQMITALIGGTIALLIAPTIVKAIRKN